MCVPSNAKLNYNPIGVKLRDANSIECPALSARSSKFRKKKREKSNQRGHEVQWKFLQIVGTRR